MNKWLISALILTVSLGAQSTYAGTDPYHPGPKYSSFSTGRSGKGPARAVRATNHYGITMAQIGAGIIIAGMVTIFAAFVTNDGTGHN
jgi:hypothetical protein